MMNGVPDTTTREATTVAGAGDDIYAGQSERVALSIANVARMFKVSTFALRLYELRGLIRRERAGREWVYSWSDCERLALIVKARKVGLHISDLKPVIVAMGQRAPLSTADIGRLQSILLIQRLESRQQAIGNVLGELYRIDWELSDRLGVKDSGGTDAGTRV